MDYNHATSAAIFVYSRREADLACRVDKYVEGVDRDIFLGTLLAVAGKSRKKIYA
jgi:hypothetical protein